MSMNIKKISYQMGIAFMMVLVSLGGHLVMASKGAGTITVQPVIEAIPGMFVILALVLLGLLCKQLIPLQIPAIAYVVLLACIVTIPGFIPGAEAISAAINKVNFMSLVTPIGAYVGLSIAKDLPQMKKAGFPLLIVTILAIVGTYLGSTIIAEMVLRLTGIV